MTSETHDAEPAPCHFCKAEQVITMPNDRAGIAGIPQGGTVEQDAFYCHCEGCGADGPIADSHWEAITLWNGPAQPVQKHDADTVERVAKAMWDAIDKETEWIDAPARHTDLYRRRSRAALSALSVQKHDADTVDNVAYAFWSIHPRDLDPWRDSMPVGYKGGVRAWYFASEMRRLFTGHMSAMPPQEVSVQEAARVLADWVDSDMVKTNELIAALSSVGFSMETPARHWLSQTIRALSEKPQ